MRGVLGGLEAGARGAHLSEAHVQEPLPFVQREQLAQHRPIPMDRAAVAAVPESRVRQRDASVYVPLQEAFHDRLLAVEVLVEGTDADAGDVRHQVRADRI